MNKLFTVVICTYNGSKNLEEVLDAICVCTDLDKLVDQIIVVDNASTDGTRDIIKAYAKRNPIVSYVFEARSGLSYARQKALLSKTEWVVYSIRKLVCRIKERNREQSSSRCNRRKKYCSC